MGWGHCAWSQKELNSAPVHNNQKSITFLHEGNAHLEMGKKKSVSFMIATKIYPAKYFIYMLKTTKKKKKKTGERNQKRPKSLET